MDFGEGSSQKKQRTEGDNLKDGTIVIKFINQDNKEFYCTTKRITKFRTIFSTYCQHYQLAQDGSVKFLYLGNRIAPKLTPAELNFPDGGEIDVMAYMGGGGCKDF